MNRILKTLVYFLLLFNGSLSIFPQSPSGKMDWWHEARFGMFIHWGVYSVLGNQYDGEDVNGQTIHYDMRTSGYPSEWIMHRAKIPRAIYRQKALQFDAINYDPKKWVEIAKHAGMKYIVITAKHHDGFCLFETQYTDWNAIEASAAGRDLLKDLVTEAHAAGLKIGFYYSQNVDWMHVGGMGDIPELNGATYAAEQVEDYVNNLVIPQIQELTTNYDIDLFWFDLPGVSNTNSALAQGILNTLLQSPVGEKVIYNDRLGGGFAGDFTTPESDTPYIPYNGYVTDHNWEACASLNNSWGFEYEPNTYNAYNFKWRTPTYTLGRILELSSKGGNFLLNVGPDRHGDWVQFAVNTLDTVGNWMQIYGETVYGTQKNQLLNPFEFGYVTQKIDHEGFHWYLHIQPSYWKNRNIYLNGITESPQSVSLFDGKESLPFQLENEKNLHITLPEIECPNRYYAVIDVCFAQIPHQILQSSIRNDTICLTPYQAVTGELSKDYDPYAFKSWYGANAKIEYQVYLEKGTYDVSAEYATFYQDGEIYFSVDDQIYSGPYFGTGNPSIGNDFSNWIVDDFGDLQFTVSESKIYTLRIQRKVEPNKTNWLSVRRFYIVRHSAISAIHMPDIPNIYPSLIRSGSFTCVAQRLQTLSIFDSQGRCVKRFSTDQTKVDVSHLSAGLYTISGDGFSKKIIIE
ncbi:MAG: alpha-L-fucosidase [Candidatus Symbiothrix sp.]|jgi:alpha-L-fucosidase|nr:alpha-L-fucosidase [Candidatus Symbiothrix sp.]